MNLSSYIEKEMNTKLKVLYIVETGASPLQLKRLADYLAGRNITCNYFSNPLMVSVII